ncbi:electron transport complex subunit RsxC [candidate division KSB1 bacterium]|nr:electron transport complex subunit RsxC [candidate division KSB1 bacterium]
MFRRLSFKGGVHPPGKKELAEKKAIEKMPVPPYIIIPVQQHIGAPGTPCVEPGQRVLTGQKVCDAKGFVSVPAHSSVTGVVKSIEPRPHPLGGNILSIIIETEGEEELVPEIKLNENYFDLSVSEMKKKILEAGIAGMGGAAFPTHVKLSPPPPKKIDILILNGAECEPYLTSDARVMIEHGDEVLAGMRILMKILDCKQGYIAIEKNKPEAIKTLRKLIKQQGDSISVIGLHVKYPQGAEKQLIKAVTDRKVPAGGLPMDVGCLVQNTGTARAIYEAVAMNKPLYERVVSVTGKGIREPANVLTRIGTPMANLFEFCGGLTDDAAKVINGGPMMGIAQADLEAPITKGTSGIVVLNRKDASMPESKPCIRCARCVDSCPMNLMPNILAQLVEHQKYEEAAENNILDCIECGCCSYVCPSKIRHVHLFKYGKLKVNKMRKEAA